MRAKRRLPIQFAGGPIGDNCGALAKAWRQSLDGSLIIEFLKTLSSSGPTAQGLWLATLRRYLVFVAAGNFVWEILQLPGFADWGWDSWSWLAFIVLIGTAGDVLIATTSLVLGLIVFGDEQWPAGRGSYWRVATAAGAFGLVYTTYSEWRHAVVLRHWTYSALMPVVPGLGVGVFPLLQWILIPAAAFYLTHACIRNAAPGSPDDTSPAPLPSRDRATTG